MDDYGPPTYGDRIAGIYDEWHAPSSFEAAGIDFLAGLAAGGPALELGIGTGRVGLPLAERGVEVHGVDASPAMIERLRAKPGGDRIPVALADFADFDLEGRFALVFVVFNGFWALLTSERQVACFRAVARHLQPGGAFVIEAFVPDPGRFDRGQRIGALQVGSDRAIIEVSRHDAARQRVTSQLAELGPGGVRMFPVQVRYVWPSELDLMAQLAGMRLRERWGGWRQELFDDRSLRHVSVYELAPG
jgi:SAM-dependent methyltransferase